MMRTSSEMLGHVRKALWTALPAFLAAGILGLLVSTLLESSGFAVAMALVLYVFGDVVTGLLGQALQQKVFLYYGPYALEKLRLFAEGSTTRWNAQVDEGRLALWVPLAWSLAMLPAAFAIFKRKNVVA
jgi:hypothetical protein